MVDAEHKAKEDFGNEITAIFESISADGGQTAAKKALVEALDAKLTQLLAIGERAGDASGGKFVNGLQAIDSDGHAAIALTTLLSIFETQGLVLQAQVAQSLQNTGMPLPEEEVGFGVTFEDESPLHTSRSSSRSSRNTGRSDREGRGASRRGPGTRTGRSSTGGASRRGTARGVRVPGARPLDTGAPSSAGVGSERTEEYIKRLQGDLAALCKKAIAHLPRHERLSMHKSSLLKKMSKSLLDREFAKYNTGTGT
jgi:hypothetical protein